LTVSHLLVKVTGLLFKIPMNYIVGDTGMGYFNSAYSIYTFFYMLSTSGLPVALAVMVSEKRAEGNLTAAKTIYRTAMALFVACGLGVFLLMFFASGELAALIRSDKSALSVAVAAPTMFFICVSSALRGYFQGCGNMLPTAISQLIEALGKLLIGIAAALYAIRMDYEIHVIAAYAVAGLTLGSLAGMVYLLLAKLLRSDRDLRVDGLPSHSEAVPCRQVLKRFLKISLPITVSASVMSLTNMLDTALIQRMLRSSGMAEEEAATLFGNYTSLAVPMFNLPPVFVYPIAYSLVPAVAAALASGRKEKAAQSIELSLRAAVLIGLPCALGLTVLADPILCLFYKASSAHLASPLLTLLAPSSFFVCLLAVTNSILQSCGEERKPVLSMLCGAVVKCGSSVLLLKSIGIAGAPVSTFLCYLTVTVLNLTFVVKCTGIRPNFFKIFFLPAAAGLACASSAAAVNGLLARAVNPKLACPAAILTGAAVYAAVLLASGNVTVNEIKTILTGAKAKENESNGRTETETENGTNPRFRLSPRAGGGSAERGRMPMGSGTDPRVHPRRPH
ncbi:MAG: oligosaccharide flippase family protein, partial [Eubacteriales bacterium]